MYWWCVKCDRWVIIATIIDPKTNQPVQDRCIEQHKERIVGIRSDIMLDETKAMVGRLNRMNRLEKMP